MSPRGVGLALERDEAVAEGRAKGGGTTYYSIPGVVLTTMTTYAATANIDSYTGWVARSPIAVDQIAAEVTTAAGTNFRIGFYRADRDWQPIGAPLADSGNLDASATGVKTYDPSTPVLVRPGRYLSVVNSDGGVSLRGIRGASVSPIQSGLGTNPFQGTGRVSRAYAAFPTPGTAWDAEAAGSSGGWVHVVVYRILTP